ncbi:hypothetical protein EIK56_25110 [Sphingomonas sp. C8-2]|nr:hypothetical protein EIK56_25110 [Sphingomonas sp. C8-2]
MRRIIVEVTTDASGNAAALSPRISGEIHQIEYVKTDFADGVDFTIEGEATGVDLWVESNVNASAARAPRQPTHSQAGAALLYASGGTAVADRIAIANDRVKIGIAQGGNAKKGTFHILID